MGIEVKEWDGNQREGGGMRIRDKNVKEIVDVSDKDCLHRPCYWPRPDPGVFTPGIGYRTRHPGRKPDWLCGNREIRGCPCPKPPPESTQPTSEKGVEG